MLKFKLISLDQTSKLGLSLFRHLKFDDERGFLKIEAELNLNGINGLTIKESYSLPFVGRGLHFQSENSPQIKIIKVQNGKILDLVYDPSDQSKTIYGFFLDEIQAVSMIIPSNFAHGFIALEPTNFTYTCLGKYSEEDETTFNVLEDISEIMNFKSISLSQKDRSKKRLKVSK